MTLKSLLSTFFAFTCLIVDILAGDPMVCAELTPYGLFRKEDGPICFTLFDTKSSWWKARETCRLHGMLFGKATSETYHQFFHFVVGEDFWIGGTNSENGIWKWADGEKMKYKNFQMEVRDTRHGWMSPKVAKTTVQCTLYKMFGWEKTDCNKPASFLCQHRIKATDDSKDIMTVSDDVDDNSMTSAILEYKATTVTGLSGSRQDGSVRDSTTPIGTTYGFGSTSLPRKLAVKQSNQRQFHRMIFLSDTQYHSLNVLQIAITNTASLIDCVRNCVAQVKCDLVNFCMQRNHCELYAQHEFAVDASRTFHPGCVVYIDSSI